MTWAQLYTCIMDELERTYPQVVAFFDGRPHELALFEALAGWAVRTFPGTRIDVRKTQISLIDGHMYACASMMRARRKADLPPAYIVVSFSAPAGIDSPRVAQQVQIRPGRWTVHVVVGEEDELDDELLGWIRDSHDIFCGR